jgi:NadR type nicotinamide-nucleotide adenylyltransferase
MAWYGSSFAYVEPPDPEVLDAAAEEARARRMNAFSPDRFTPRPDPGGDTTAVVLGRFLPVHDGHRYLIEVARAFARRVWVFVRVNHTDRIPWDVRRDWFAELFPDLDVVPVEDPAHRFTRDDLFALWVERVRAHVDPDYVVLGSEYGGELARRFGAQAVRVDRWALPVSGSAVRSWPARHARYLPAPVRSWYLATEPAMQPFGGPPTGRGPLRRVCLIGPESTMKSRLAGRLASRYGTVAVPEFARDLREDWKPEWVSMIGHAQQATQDALARRADRVLFCDTDLLAVRLWSERLFGAAPEWLHDATRTTDIDLYLLTSPDHPFTGPPTYDRPGERTAFFHRCREELDRLGRPYVILAGSFDGRLRRAAEAVDALLATPHP